jgi:hypothetical protein
MSAMNRKRKLVYIVCAFDSPNNPNDESWHIEKVFANACAARTQLNSPGKWIIDRVLDESPGGAA